jgi:hypothetical protein
MKAGLRYNRWFLTVFACAAMSPIALGATTLHVGGGGTDLKTIQAAVDAAVAGDTIVLNPGTYSGAGNCDVDLKGKAVTIQSTNPLDPNTVEMTILECGGSQKEPHRGFYVVDCNGAAISGLTITHGLVLAGGAIYCQNSTLDLMHCRIVDNATLPGGAADPNGGPGGGIYCENSIVRVTECLIRGNATGSGASSQDKGAGAAGNGAGICGVRSDISAVSSTITMNVAGAGGDGGQASAGSGGDGAGLFGNSIRLVNCTVSLSTAGAGGPGAPSGRGGRGAGICAETAVLDRCIIEANRAGDGGKTGTGAKGATGSSGGDGGGLYSSNSLEITNSLITGNRAGKGTAADASGSIVQGNGGGIWCTAGIVRLCTVAGNAVYAATASAGAGVSSSGGQGAGIFCTSSTKVTSSILYGNTPDQLVGYDRRNVTYCNIKIPVDPSAQTTLEPPVFVRDGKWVSAKDPQTAVNPDDPNAVWVQGDYRLRATSPLFDAGDPNYVPGRGETDLSGNPRLADAAVDVGAYESAARVPVYRFWSPTTGKHFYTVSETEKDKLLHQYANDWTFEGPVYDAYSRPSEPNLLPVYRFWSDQLNSHFYTLKETEKDKLIQQYAHVWTLEGPVFYAYPEGRQAAGTKAVYRFWSDTLSSHFYTIQQTEKDTLVNQYANVWAFEGVAWYAYENAAGGAVEPNATDYEFSGGSQEAVCTISLKALIDGKEAKIDQPEVTYIPDGYAYMRMTVDLGAKKATLDELLLQTALLPHTATIGGDGAGSVQIPIVLTSSIIFWGQASRGPFGIDPKTLAFPTTGSGSLPGSDESFTISGTVTVDGNKLEIGLVQRATDFTTGDPGTFDTSALPDRLNAHMAGTFQWSRQQHQDLLLETTVKGSVLQLYVTSARIQTTGVWQGKKSP